MEAFLYDPELDDSVQWRMQAIQCPACQHEFVAVHRADRGWACPYCTITDRFERIDIREGA